jgi:flavin-dependent dehydrogenase
VARQGDGNGTTVAVIGGGPAGAVVAIRLARAGCPVSLIEGDGPNATLGENLAPAAKPLLQAAGAWDSFLEAGHVPCYAGQSAWGSSRLAERDSIFDPYGCGWHLDRGRFDGMLRLLAGEAGALRHAETWLTLADPDPRGGWRLRLASSGGGASLHARLVVDATGRASCFARTRGVRRTTFDRLVGVACLFRDGPGRMGDEDARTLVEAVEQGWWYSALVPGGLLVVYMTDGDLLAAGPARSAAGWAALLAATTHTAERVRARDDHPSPRPCVAPAMSSLLDAPAGEGWLAVGDAAASYDPLSSRGITTALATGLRAADCILAWLGGDHTALLAHAKEVTGAFHNYLDEHAAYYGLERRWPDALFWRRRADRRKVDERRH